MNGVHIIVATQFTDLTGTITHKLLIASNNTWAELCFELFRDIVIRKLISSVSIVNSGFPGTTSSFHRSKIPVKS